MKTMRHILCFAVFSLAAFCAFAQTNPYPEENEEYAYAVTVKYKGACHWNNLLGQSPRTSHWHRQSIQQDEMGSAVYQQAQGRHPRLQVGNAAQRHNYHLQDLIIVGPTGQRRARNRLHPAEPLGRRKRKCLCKARRYSHLPHQQPDKRLG